ncbi:MAG TPA: hypothetical protein VLA52_03550, partial [Thermohalobaculum sp.]|nr:hypothetical protein [Thermohalobaculum sp.]
AIGRPIVRDSSSGQAEEADYIPGSAFVRLAGDRASDLGFVEIDASREFISLGGRVPHGEHADGRRKQTDQNSF